MQKIKAFAGQLVTGLSSTSLGIYFYQTAKYSAYSPSTTTFFLVFGVLFSLFGALVALDSINHLKN